MTIGFAKTSAHFRSSIAGTPSGPAAELDLSSFIAFFMFSSVKWMLVRVCLLFPTFRKKAANKLSKIKVPTC